MDPEDVLHLELGHLFGEGLLWERNELSGFGKPIHYCQDGGVAFRWGETRDKVQGYEGQAEFEGDQPELAKESCSVHRPCKR